MRWFSAWWALLFEDFRVSAKALPDGPEAHGVHSKSGAFCVLLHSLSLFLSLLNKHSNISVSICLMSMSCLFLFCFSPLSLLSARLMMGIHVSSIRLDPGLAPKCNAFLFLLEMTPPWMQARCATWGCSKLRHGLATKSQSIPALSSNVCSTRVCRPLTNNTSWPCLTSSTLKCPSLRHDSAT